MNKLLLTGFEPFFDYPINPTMQVVEELDGKVINDYKVIGKILSVDFSESGKELLNYIETIDPDAIISLGLSGSKYRYKISPERIAINCNDGESDNRGYAPKGEKIIKDGPDGIFTTLPIHKMINELEKAGLPAQISNTAGTYLCNNVMYHGLYHNKKRKNGCIPTGFIHIPASHELAILNNNMHSWSHSDLVKAIHICIECL